MGEDRRNIFQNSKYIQALRVRKLTIIRRLQLFPAKVIKKKKQTRNGVVGNKSEH